MSDAAPDRRALLQQALRAVEEAESRLAASEASKREPIAIVGMGCRFPGGADDPESYWRLLRDGVDATCEVPADRWDAGAFYDPDPDAPGKMITRRGGFLRRVDLFDPAFFGISPREAATLDPQQRLLLEVAWEALEDAGLAPDRLRGSSTGVFVGITTSDYAKVVGVGDAGQTDVYAATGNALNAAAGRLSFVLGLHGPCAAVDTACSSSLTALHLACQSLRNGESGLALAGGVNVVLLPEASILFSKWGMLAPDGRCKTFDASADGFVRAEGCAVLALKRLSDARAAGDRILALVRGSAVNQDGASSGLTVPNGPAQQMAIRAALERAGVAPSEVDYVEAHGTGTPLGDPIEVEALAAVMDAGRPADRPLRIGSVKANLGHTEAASGLAGLMKVVLSLQHEAIPPHLHLTQLNPRIPWQEYRIAVPTQLQPWPRGARRRIAGVSSFGFSGTNAHVVVEEAPPEPQAPAAGLERPRHAIALSGRSQAALLAAAGRLAQHLDAQPSQRLADVAHTANVGRAAFGQRAVVLAAEGPEARERLQQLAQGVDAPGVIQGRAGSEPPRLAFLFTGQGAQYTGMGRSLYDTQPTFRAALDRCAQIAEPQLDRPLLDVMFGAAGCEGLVDRTRYTQPALFALEWALAQTWRSWGVEPGAVLGHSVGEFVAACVAGVLSLEDGLGLITERARLMDALPAGGEMAAVHAPEERVRTLLAAHARDVSIAAVNGPESVVISGSGKALARALAALAEQAIKTQALTVSHAFHSPLMEPMLAALEQAAARVEHRPPGIDLISNLSGRLARADEQWPAYWRRHAREAVRFADGLAQLETLGYRCFLELGPAPVLIGMGQRALSDEGLAWLPSLRKGRDDWSVLLESVARLWVGGTPVDWSGFDRDYPRTKLALPTYPFQRERHWVSAAGAARRPPTTASASHPLLGRRLASPLEVVQFESELGAGASAFLAEHRFYGTAVVPATAFVEMASAAAAALGAGLAVESLEIEQALPVPDGETRTVQTVLSPEDGREAAFSIFSLSPEGDWIRHASGRIADPVEPAAGANALAEVRERCREELAAADYYGRFAHVGVHLGPAFRVIEAIWRGDGEALARARLPLEDAGAGYLVHPALLDAAAFHLLGAALPGELEAPTGAYMPTALGGIRIHGPVPASVWSHVRVERDGADGLSAQARLFDDDGRVLVEIGSLRLRRVSREALEAASPRSFAGWLYELDWTPLPAEPEPLAAGGSWLVFADGHGVGAALTASLRGHGQRVIVVHPGVHADLGGENVVIDPADAQHYAALLQHAQGAGALRGVVHLWALDAIEGGLQPLAQQEGVCGSALNLARVLGAATAAPRLWLVTRGAQAVGGEESPLAVSQAPLWGFARTLSLEHPELRCTCVDLDPAGDASARLEIELALADGERDVAWRGSQRLVARLAHSRALRRARPTDHAVQLAQTTPGVLDGLACVRAPRKRPGPGEVELDVEACGLNFRDVMGALGMYPGGPLPLGNECAGRVSAVGEGVEHVRPGDEVVALAPGALASHVTTHAHLVAARPPGLSMEEAASVPTAFLTAAYGLEHLAKLSRGERVLIQAAAGGVGLAAVQLARRAGAEIFATAGSEAKRAYLCTLGVEHVFDSRSLGYAAAVRERTGGQGVDVVLNSFVGEYIPLSLSLLRSGGRFLEIGKREIWDEARVHSAYPGVSYHAYDLAERFQADPVLAGRMLQELMDALGRGELRALPTRAFSFEDAARAFRYMAQARHIGKVVLRPDRHPGALTLRPDGSYLVTGGMGGLGLSVAGWLVDKGARHLVLLGRSEPGAAASAGIEALRARGATVSIARVDVAEHAALAALLETFGDRQPPLRGIVHCAGVVDDHTVRELDWNAFARVMAPKVAGSWNLHTLTPRHPLELFVLFSSASSMLGSAGQANYAAANAYLDALAWRRRAEGLPALSINWGPWDEVGMAAALSERDQRRRRAQGVGMIPPAAGLRCLEQLLLAGETQAAVLPVDWPRFLAQYQDAAPPRVYSAIAREAPAASAPSRPAAARKGEARRRLEQSAPERRLELLCADVTEQVMKVLGLDGARVPEADEPLPQLGMDSLMAVELRNRLQLALDLPLPATLALEHPSIAALAAHLARELRLAAAEPIAADPAQRPETVDAARARDLLEGIGDLSEGDVDRLLRDMTRREG